MDCKLALHSEQGFTYIEMIIAVTFISLVFFPLMHVFSLNASSVTQAGDVLTATNLAREEMEKVKNLGFSEEKVRNAGSSRSPAVKVNGVEWTVVRSVKKNSDPLEVKVAVFRAGNSDRSVVELVTLIEDLR